jgi:hypothetical protein
MGFKILSDIPGSDNLPDICLKLPQDIYVVIEARDIQSLNKLTSEEKEKALAKMATERIKPWKRECYLSYAVEVKLGVRDIDDPISINFDEIQKESSKLVIPIKDSYKILSKGEVIQALAIAAREEFTLCAREEYCNLTSKEIKLSDAKIAAVLSKAANNAAIYLTNEGGEERGGAEEPIKILALLLSVHKDGMKVKAFFGSMTGKLER